MTTAKLFLKWVIQQYSYVNDDIIAHGMAKSYCRKKWNEYGEKIIKRALNDMACKSIPQFEAICKHLNST